MSPLVFLLFVNVLLLILGCFLEGTTIILVILPVLLPTAVALGIDPVHFGVVAIVNIMFGLITPPYRPAALHDGQDLERAAARSRTRNPPVSLRDGGRARADYARAGFVLFLPRLMGYAG